jgi:hypothetical protein
VYRSRGNVCVRLRSPDADIYVISPTVLAAVLEPGDVITAHGLVNCGPGYAVVFTR